MVLFLPSSEADIPVLTRWIEADSDHRGRMEPEWWIEGAKGSSYCYAVEDELGLVGFIRLDDNRNSFFRLHAQFAPKEEVPPRRTILAVVDTINRLEEYFSRKKMGLVFDSVSPRLIKLMKSLGFVGIGNNEYRYIFRSLR